MPVISPADQLLLDEVFRRAQLNCAGYRTPALGRRVPACLRALHARSPIEAVRRLQQDPASIELALNALLIGVTAFFRDRSTFAHLQQSALPDLLRTTSYPRVLSVGCSDGAELYSLAICLREAGAHEFSLTGVDCRRRALEKARAGLYTETSLAHLPPALRHRHFTACRGHFRVSDHILRQAHWHHADATLHLPQGQGPFDLIACRNLAIYLEHPTTARLWRGIHSLLRSGGLLLVGKAERPTAGFFRSGPCTFRKVTP